MDIDAFTHQVNGGGETTVGEANGAIYKAAGATDAVNNIITGITTNSAVTVKFIPVTYTYYTIDLKSSDRDSVSSYDRGTVTMDDTVVNRYARVGSGPITTSAGMTTHLDNDTRAIKTVILTVDNGATLSGMPDSWTSLGTVNADRNYYHYNLSSSAITEGALTAQEVQEALQGLTLTTANANAKYNLSVFLYETEMDSIPANYGGHFYQYIPGSYTWADAYKAAKSAYTQLGQANTYLAAITTQGESNYLDSTLNVSNAWMAAITSNQTSGISEVGNLINGRTGWFWVAGPEAGTQFMTNISVAAGATTSTGQYTNWRGGEPNNCGGYEWAAAFNYNGWKTWNDFNGTNRYGYIVEYQAAPGSAGDVFANDVFTYTKNAASSGGTGSGGGGGGGGAAATPTEEGQPGIATGYKISPTDFGSVSPGLLTPKAGEKTTFTTIPSPGYQLTGFIVKDKNGNQIPVTNEGNGRKKIHYHGPSGNVFTYGQFKGRGGGTGFHLP